MCVIQILTDNKPFDTKSYDYGYCEADKRSYQYIFSDFNILSPIKFSKSKNRFSRQ